MGEPEAKRARTSFVVDLSELKCPITLELFRDPVSNCVGNTYERAAIEAHLAKPGAKRDPLTNEALANATLVPNQSLRRQVQNFLDAHPDYTPEGWENRMVPPLPGAVKSALAEVAAAKAANSVPRLLASLSSLPNAVEVQAAGFRALRLLIIEGDEELYKQACDSEVYDLVLSALSHLSSLALLTPVPAAMRNYRSNVSLQTEACVLFKWLYLASPFSTSGLASGASLLELVLAAAVAHGADANCANAVCTALASLLIHGESARAAAEHGGVKAVLALTAAHAEDDNIQSKSMCVLARMIQHSDWRPAVQAEAGGILAAAVRSLSAAHVAGSFRQRTCIATLSRLVEKDSSYAERIIASGSFEITVKAMGANLHYNALQGNGCELLYRLAETPYSSALPLPQLTAALNAVLSSMDKHKTYDIQRSGCLALKALQLIIRRRLCSVAEAAVAFGAGKALVSETVRSGRWRWSGRSIDVTAAHHTGQCEDESLTDATMSPGAGG